MANPVIVGGRCFRLRLLGTLPEATAGFAGGADAGIKPAVSVAAPAAGDWRDALAQALLAILSLKAAKRVVTKSWLAVGSGLTAAAFRAPGKPPAR